MHNPTSQGRGRATGVAAVAAAVAILALPAGASAAKWRGIVVDADRDRGTVATATRSGEVRTVRPGAKVVKRARVGQRVVVDGRRLADGTYRARKVRTRGRTRTATVRGAVVASRSRQLLVSAGDTVLEVRKRSSRRAAAASGAGVGVGDVIVADVRLGARSLHLSDVEDVGDAKVLELEGIVLGLSGGILRIAVAERGEVQIVVPDGMLTSAPAPGDEAEAVVSVGSDGSFTLLALDVEDEGREDDDDHGLEADEEEGEVDAEGILAAVSAESVSLQVGSQTLTCAVPAGAPDLTGAFSPGEEAEAECRLIEGTLVLQELETEGAEFEVTDDGGFKLEVEGADDDASDDEDDE